MTWGGDAVDAAPGAPMPVHGKSLGKLVSADFKTIVEKALVQYGQYAISTNCMLSDYLVRR